MPNTTTNHSVTPTNIMGDEIHLQIVGFLHVYQIDYQLRTSHAENFKV